MRTKTNFILLALLPLCLLVAGCTPPLEGSTWRVTTNNTPNAPQGTVQTMTFGKDGTVTHQIEMPSGSLAATGTFKVSGDKLAFRYTKVVSTTPSGDVVGQMGKEGEYDAPFRRDGDKMTLTLKDKPLTLDRVKQ
jgi:hypothetical protein